MPRQMDRSNILLSLTVVALSGATYMVMHVVVEPHLPVRAAEVPPIAGLSAEQARGILEPRGLLLVIDGTREGEGDAVPGTLVEQRPLGGSRLPRGGEVHALLVHAGEPRRVPRLSGLTLDAARAQLEAAHLRLGSLSEASADVPAGQVASSTPAQNAEVRPGAVIDLVMSKGPAAQAVPSVVGKRLSAAKQLLEKAGFAVGATRYGSNDDYDEGVVIGQSPTAGSQATPGVKIDLVIND
jgi:serine/threonine-protein kinase